MNAVAPETDLTAFRDAFRQGFEEVLQQALAPGWKVEIGSDPAPQPEAADCLSLGLTFEGSVTGKAGIVLPINGASILANAFVGTTAADPSKLNEEEAEAVAELFRQVTGIVATALGATYGQLKLQVTASSEAPPETSRKTAVIASLDGSTPIAVHLWVASELLDSMTAAVSTEAKTEQAEGEHRDQPPVDPEDKPTDDLSLLMGLDVEVEVRLGNRVLPLKSIASMTPGYVLALAQTIHEPVELVVASQVIAEGEIVTVAGCYGLQITRVRT